MGTQPRKATAEEQAQMDAMTEDAMQEGAVGISFGLGYIPGTFADREEIAGICRVVARYQGVCAFHIRSESADLIESIREALEIGEKSGVKIQLSHLKAGGEKNWYKIDEVFGLIDDARERGVIVYADAYPYTASYAELGVHLPSRFYEREDRAAFFQDPANHPEIFKALHDYYGENTSKWRNTLIANIADESLKSLEGKTLEEIAELWQVEPEQALIDLLAKTSFEVSAFAFSQSPEVVGRVLEQPYVMVGSDSIADGTHYPHPRAFGSFPKYLSEYTQTESGLSLGEAIRRVTSLPAEQFGLGGRGRVAVGYHADLVIFDPEEIRDRATYQDPTALPAGVQWVFLDGQPVVQNGKLTGLKQGKVLLRERESQTADSV
jgi:N-acyl-D-aspartate/D-glutamate deacylase